MDPIPEKVAHITRSHAQNRVNYIQWLGGKVTHATGRLQLMDFLIMQVTENPYH